MLCNRLGYYAVRGLIGVGIGGLGRIILPPSRKERVAIA